jgi:microcystin-dependent protein
MGTQIDKHLRAHYNLANRGGINATAAGTLSAKRGFILPQKTTTERNALPATVGWTVFDSTLVSPQIFDGASWQYVGTPAGSLIPFAGSTAPNGYLLCDGTAVSRTTYAALFAAVGTTWGIGDGSTTFNLPNLARRTLVGSGGTGTGTLGNTLGSTGGAETHTLATSEIPAHTHTYTEPDAPTATGASGAPTTTEIQTRTAGVATGSTGGGGAHNNMQPSAVVKWLIKT